MHPCYRTTLKHGYTEIEVVIVLELCEGGSNFWFAQGLNYNVQGTGHTVETALENLVSSLSWLPRDMSRRRVPDEYHRHHAHAICLKRAGAVSISNPVSNLEEMDRRASARSSERW
jgi:hypothetical protein